jgi:EAL domain-containing protein (putative c-di-GMP-specific phosphodiesterase class I)
MAHSLNLQVVAEGVENEEQLAFLNSLGCDLLQGYHFSRPVPLAEFERYLKDSS